MASCLPVKEIMNDTCQHCGELIVGNAYRVTSEDQGIPLLDMVVCSLCFMEANKLQLEAERIIIRDSAFNFNTGSFTQRLSSVVKTWSAERLIEVLPR